MNVLGSLSCIGLSAALLASPALAQSRFGEFAQAKQRVLSTFDCRDESESPGYWTCKTAFDFKRGRGEYPVDITINYRSYDNDAVVSYKMTVARPLIRPDSFEVFVGFTGFTDPALAQMLMQQDNAVAYSRGETRFRSNGVVVIASDFSDKFSTEIIAEADDHSIDTGAPCPRIASIEGWQASFSRNTAGAEPSFRQLEPEGLVSGQFSWVDGQILPSFTAHRIFPRSLSFIEPASQYVTVLNDGEPIYQGQWIEKREPTCCSTRLHSPVAADTFKALETGKVATIVISRDKEMRSRVAAAEFDPSGAWKAIEFAGRLGNDMKQRFGPGTGCN